MKVGFTGPFGDANFGDYAMLVNNIYDMDEKNIIVFSYNKELMQLLNNGYLKTYNIEECIVDIDYNYIPTLGNNYSVEYDDTVEIPVEIISRCINLEEVKRKISEIDILIVNGGGYFNNLWNAKHRKKKLYSILVPIIIASELNKKIVFAGNTYGPFESSDKFYFSFFNSLRNVEYYSRDDVYSMAWLRQIGVHNELKLIPDDLYFVNEKILKKCDNDYGDYIILELYSSMNEIEIHLKEIKKFVEQIYNCYGYKTLLLPLDRNYGGEYQSNFIKENIPEIIYVDFEESEYRPIEQINSLVSNAKFVVCQRYHMFVFSMANKTPAIHILKDVCGDKRYYFTKTYGLLTQVFKNQSIQENLFMKTDLKEALNEIVENFHEIIDYQKLLFNDKMRLNEEQMRKARKKFFDCIKLNVNNDYLSSNDVAK